MFNLSIEGLDSLERKLAELGQRARAIDGTHRVVLNDLFTESFMKRHTRFDSFADMLEASEWTVETVEDFEAIPDGAWERWVRDTTSFTNWDAMQRAAGENWIARKLGL